MAVGESRHQRGAVPLHHCVMAEVVAIDGQDELAASSRCTGGRDGGNGWGGRARSTGQCRAQGDRQHCPNRGSCHRCQRFVPPADWRTTNEVPVWNSRGAGLAEPHNSPARIPTLYAQREKEAPRFRCLFWTCILTAHIQQPIFRASRRSSRVPLKVTIDVENDAESLTREGETVVVNLHGALLSTRTGLSVGMRISVHVYLTDKRANTPRTCLLYTSPSPRDPKTSRMPSSA